MSALQCIIIDDEPLPLVLLSDYIKKTPFLQLAGTYMNPLDALMAVQQQPIDLIFLDIQMPELNGVQFMELINGKCKVIFTTAYPNYALKGYELDVLDYLLKPISFERFLKAVSKMTPLSETDLAQKPKTPSGEIADMTLFVKVEHKIVKVFLSEIQYIEGLKGYVAIHTQNKKIITLQSMKKMEEALPLSRFLRIHKSFIVALEKIDSIERNRVLIKNNIIPIGDTYKESFFAVINGKDLL
jgi:DNA-binding LytR/AlgR family response regulator